MTKLPGFLRRKFSRFLTVTVGVLGCASWLGTGRAAGAPAADTVRVACVGDSITFGSGISDRDRDSYPAVLQRLLGTQWDVRNFGVSGATLLKHGDKPYVTQQAHADALAFAPGIAIIMLGTNDSKHPGGGLPEGGQVADNWRHKGDFVADYEALIAEFQRANPGVKVYVCLPPPAFPGRWGIDDRTIHDEVIPLVRQVAGETKAEIIDINAAMAGKKELFPDTVHPNAAGAKLMAETVYQALTGKAAITGQ